VATDGHARIKAAPERWQQLGNLLRIRRIEELDYPHQKPFAADRLPPSSRARKVNTKLVVDVEGANRRNGFQRSTLKNLVAPAWQVTYESIVAFLEGKADGLVPAPAPPASAAAPSAAPGFPGPAPMADEARADANRPYGQAICRDLVRAGYLREVAPGWFERTGAPEPSGAQLFGEGTPDARTWDNPDLRGRLTVTQMVWLVAELRRIDAERADAARNGTGLAGALGRGAVSQYRRAARGIRNAQVTGCVNRLALNPGVT
jgi:hypothetical protein